MTEPRSSSFAALDRKLNVQYDITPVVIDPKGEIENWKGMMPGLDGLTEYGFAVTTEAGKRLSSTLARRLENEVLRDLAAFAQQNPGLDFSKVQLVEGPRMPVDAANNDWNRWTATKEEREASRATATRFTYTRGWYTMTKEVPND